LAFRVVVVGFERWSAVRGVGHGGSGGGTKEE